MDASGPNADQIKYWNEMAGAKWVAFQDALDRQIEPLGLAAMDAIADRLVSGARVLDVGCGCGATTLELARRVAPGPVAGVDVSVPMLARARERAEQGQFTNVAFERADAQTHHFEPGSHDVVFSRFGVMFFSDPPAAFANLKSALRPNGKLAFACWQPLDVNPWMSVPARAAATVIPVTARPPGAPGPFAFSDPEYVRGILERAALRDIAITSHVTDMTVGEAGMNLDETARFAMQFGPTAVALREAPADAVPRVFDAVRTALAPFETDRGIVLTAAIWIVTASP